MKMRLSFEVNEIWLPSWFDPEVFSHALAARLPGSRIKSVITNMECRQNQIRVEYQILSSQKDELPDFLQKFAEDNSLTLTTQASSFVGSMDTWHPAWYKDTGRFIH